MNKAHRKLGGAGDGTVRAIDGGYDGDLEGTK